MRTLESLTKEDRRKLLELATRSLQPKAAAPPISIQPCERGDLVPLSYAQQRLWFLSQMEGGSRAYHMPFGLELRGRVDVGALCRALDRIVERHEALRTTFEQVGDEPRQRVREAEPFKLRQEDVRECDDPLAEVRSQAAAEVAEPFDLEQGPVIRGRLVRHGEEAYTLLVTMHHIATDGWSMGIFFRELRALYGAFARGEADPLPALPVQYADYALWQRSEAVAERLEEQAQYWERTLAGAPTALELPLDRRRPAEQDYAGAALRIELDAELTGRLKKLSQRADTTLFMTVMAGWTAVLARLSRQDEVVVGTPVANRTHSQIEGLIGFFVNTLALRVGVEGDLTVRELLARVKACALEAQRHQDLPFEQVVERVQPERSLAHSPIFQVVLAWQNSERGSLDLPGLEVRASEAATHAVSKFDLTLSLGERGDGIAGALEYATSLFDEATIERLIGHFRTLLAAMAEDESQEIGAIELLSAEERRQVLEVWNDTAREPPAGTLAELFERQAARTPEAMAIRHGEVELSYRELDEGSNRLARLFRAEGVAAGQVVAVALPRSVELVTSFLAVLKVGAVFLPVEPDYPAQRRAFLLADAEPVGLITRRELWGELPEDLMGWDWEEAEPRWAELSCERPDWSRGTASEAAYIIYTSGSTGTPKGVVVPHRAVVRVAVANGYAQIEAEDRMAFASNPAFDAAMLELWAPLLAGAALVVVDQDTLLSPERLKELLEGEGVSALWLTVGLFNQYADALSGVFAGLRFLLTGGDVLDPRVIDRVLRHSRPRHLINGYGPTETAVFAATHEIESVEEGRSIPIGRPIANTRIYILDERRQPVPVGAVGEIYIGGAGVALGYLKREELTAERFLADPFAAEGGARMYRTGDLGRWLPDGTIEFWGRNDFQVKVRGFRVELGEIEARLEELAGVREAVVVVREDEPGAKRLVAYVVGEEGEEIEAEALSKELRQLLPEYMVPAAYVRLERLPVTPNGKVDRRALPAPGSDAYAGARFEEPEGETEQGLAEIWTELLRVERVGRHDNFFDLGGHSLLAVRVVNAVGQQLGVEIAVRDVFTQPQLKELASVVQGAQRSRREQIPRVERPGLVPLSYAQQRLWFLSQMEGASRTYHIPFGVELRGAVDVDALCRALDRILERHEALRTTFEQVEGEPWQRVREAEPFRLVQEDLRHCADPLAEVGVQARAEVAEAFDLERGPVIRGRLLRHGDEAYTLLVTMHHIASDGWSMGIFLRELGALYGALTRGEADPLPALPVQYGDYAVWQRSEEVSGKLEQQAQYWERTLEGAPTVLELPFDRPRPAKQDYAGAALRIELDAELSGRLKALSQRHGTTLFMTVMAGWIAVLSRLSRQEDVVVGTPVANRSHSQIEGLIGFFVNTLVLRVGVEGDLTVRELLARVKACALEAQQNQDLPFEQVVERVQPERSLSHSPIFQVMLVWQTQDRATLDLPGLEVQASKGAAHVVSQFDLTLSLGEWGDRIAGAVEYATSLFDEVTVQRVFGYLRTVLAAMAEDEEQEIGAIELLSPEERRRVLVEWNDTGREVVPATLPELFEQQVVRNPEAIAVRHGEVTLSYGELDERANRLAHSLRGDGVEAGQVVAVALPRGVELVVAFLGVLKAETVYLPVDLEAPLERRSFLLDDARPVRLITFRDEWGELPEGLAAWDWSQEEPRWAALPCEPPPRKPGAVSLGAYIIYTSGSTGIPKGVVVTHRGIASLVAEVQRETFKLSPDSRVLQYSSVSFDAWVIEVLMALCVGASLVIPTETKLVGDALSELVRQEEITNAVLTPALVNTVSALPECLASLWVAGDVVTATMVERCGTGRRLFNAYGPTESTICATISEPLRPGDPITIGRPITNTRIYLLDERCRPVPVGVVGEIYIGGMGVAQGYLNREELTAERFLADPFTPDSDARMYRSGDLGRWWPDGTLEFCGRNDFQVKVRGYRVELGEIEARLQEVVGIREAVVVAQATEPGDKRLVAYVVGDEGLEGEELKAEGLSAESLSAESLSAHLRQVLPDYMVPAAYVVLERLPMTSSGKVNRRALPAPETDAYLRARFEEPQGETEQALARIWGELLSVEQVSRHDSFFDLGGHSLLTVRFLSEVRKELPCELSLRDVFENPVLKDFAALLETGHGRTLSDARILADLTLDPAIRRDDPRPAAASPENILLTGATGFFGAFLLRSLLRSSDATIHCLVRAGSPKEAHGRIVSAMSRYGIERDFESDRVVAIPGDLGEQELELGSGAFQQLADRIDLIVHNGAWVSAAHTYETLKGANVDGTRELLRLASLGAPKPIHFVSTFNTVLTPSHYPEVGAEQECVDYFRSLPSGYSQSKWVAEMLLQAGQARGLATETYRAPLIGAARCTGASNSNDLLSRFIDQCLELGCFPEIPSELNVIAVDDLSDRLVALALGEAQVPRYNLLNDESLSMSRVVERLSHLTAGALKRVSDGEWLQRSGRSADGDILSMALQTTALQTTALQTTALQSSAGAPGVSDWKVTARRCDEKAKLEAVHSPLDDEYLDRYLRWRMEKVGNHEHRNSESEVV